MTVKIRLSQEGYVRSNGYQLTQWINRVPAGVTDPLSYAELFVLRRTEEEETLDRVATAADMAALPINVLQYFEAKFAGADALAQALPGDVLNVLTVLPHWLQGAAPYTTQSFTVAALETLASGLLPKTLPGNQILLPGYEFTDRDIGRWVTLAGFATAGYNTQAQVLSYAGSVAQVALTITTSETGVGWSIPRVRIETNPNPAQEKRYFPTLERMLSWEIRRGGSTVVASGAAGFTQRTNPDLTYYRDHRVTRVAASADEAESLAIVSRRAVEGLQAVAERLDTTFLNLQTYDYPVP